jgi:hypothetical protein
MGLRLLRPGHRIRTRDGAEAEVLSATEDGEWIRARYLGHGDNPLFSETEDLVYRDKVEALLSITHVSTWGEKVTVILHHVPESEESESEYEAEPMSLVDSREALTFGQKTRGPRGWVEARRYSTKGPAVGKVDELTPTHL